MGILHILTNRGPVRKRTSQGKRPRIDLLTLSFIFVLASFIENLALLVEPSYAASLTNINYEKVGTIDNCGLIQGSASDGTDVYSACVNGASHSSTTIVKTNLSGQELARSKSYSRSTVGHANDMTYNSKTGRLILTAWDESGAGSNGITNKARIINPSNLSSVESTATFDKGTIPNICYNSNTDQYVANGKLYSSSYRYIKTIFSTSVDSLNAAAQMTGSASGQGIGCDSSYIYVIRWSSDKSITRIIAFDWSGNVANVYNVTNMKDEIESLFFVADVMYAGVNNSSGTSSYIIKLSDLASNSTSVPFTIGSYNILGYYHGEGSRYASDRLAQIVKNINSMAYDVVGLQEYRDQVSGDSKALIHKLKELNPSYEMSYTKEVEDSGQLNFIYNSSTVQLVSDRAFRAYSSRQGCGGGTLGVRVATFNVLASGQEFMIVNVHTVSEHGPSACDNVRLETVKGALADSKVSSYTGPLFLVGDFNARPDNPKAGNYDPGPENFLKSNGFANARDISNATREGGGTIDHIYYRTSSIAAPSTYEAMICIGIDPANPANYTAKTTCASDHHPIKATFGADNLCGDASSSDTTTTNAYKAHNNIHYTGTNSVCCATASSAGDGSGTLTGSSNAEKAFNFLTTTSFESNGGKPLNAAQAAGIVGNLMVESGGKTYDLRPDAVNSIGAAGIVQWYKGRRVALNSFAASKGKDWTDLKTQLQFIVYELDGSYFKQTVMVGSKAGGKDINKGLANITDSSEASVRIAADIVGRWYETPSISDHYPDRQDAAVKAFNDFGGGASSATTASSVSCSQETPGTFATTVESYVWADGRRVSKQKDAYQAAVKQSSYGNDAAHNYGNDCGAFVYILMTTSGFEPDYPGKPTSGQMAWLHDHWDTIAEVGKVDVGALQPGDVAIRDGHVFVWVGGGLKDENNKDFAGKSAEAALGSDTAPTTILSGNTYSDPSGYTWYRKKAS